jgi:hypothetical protein
MEDFFFSPWLGLLPQNSNPFHSLGSLFPPKRAKWQQTTSGCSIRFPSPLALADMDKLVIENKFCPKEQPHKAAKDMAY